jgi:hypothetical protein
MIDGRELVCYADLIPLGVPYSKVHLCRLEKQGRFPARVAFSCQRKLYVKSEVVAWIQQHVAARGNDAVETQAA